MTAQSVSSLPLGLDRSIGMNTSIPDSSSNPTSSWPCPTSLQPQPTLKPHLHHTSPNPLLLLLPRRWGSQILSSPASLEPAKWLIAPKNGSLPSSHPSPPPKTPESHG